MVRIAIPVPTSLDEEYNSRSLPPYLEALRESGAEPVVIHLDASPAEIARALATTEGVLLPGSKYDVDPERYGTARIPECNPADPARAAADELLLQDAFNLRKPVLAICYGIQSLNVWCNGTLAQDLPAEGLRAVNHNPGRDIVEAHAVDIMPQTRLASLARDEDQKVNSSHHQAVKVPGDNLHVTAVSPADGVIEAVELGSTTHFVVGVQWHPERTYAESPLSSALFDELIREAGAWQPVAPQIGGDIGSKIDSEMGGEADRR
jgi:putative glutamine amidotransferase